jgi:peptide/nickel transport system substrate-binding protein
MRINAWWQRLAVGVAVVALISGCGGGGSKSTSSTSSNASSTTSTNASNSGGGSSNDKTLVYAAQALPETRDPCFISSSADADVLPEIYGFGTYFKQVKLPDGTMGDDTSDSEKGVGPWVFQSWDVSPDAKQYTLHLRPGIVDSYGNTLTASDIKWELARIADPKSNCNFVTTNMNLTDVAKQVQVVDANTLKITIPKPSPVFLRMLTINNGMFFGSEARKHATSSDKWANKWLKTHAPAIGPYKISSVQPGVQVILVRNPKYNLGPQPYYDKVIYREVPQDANRLALLESGQAHVAQQLTQSQRDQANSNPNTYVVCNAAIEFVAGFMNVNKKSPVAKLAVRQALAYATPYSDVIKSVYGGQAKRLYGMAPGNYPAYIGDAAYPISGTDVAKAKQLLAQAGYPHGFSMSVMINSDEPENERTAVLLQNAFKQIGVNMQINSKPNTVYYDALDKRTYGDMTIERTFALVPDYGYHSALFLKPGPPPNVNWSGWENPQFTKALAQQKTMPDGQQRDAVLGQMQRVFNQQVPWLSIANVPTCVSLSKKVTGYHWHTVGAVWYPDLKPGS